MTVKIAYVTTARSDYGPAYWLIHDLLKDARFDVGLVVGGSHLSEKHGLTVTEIEKDGWPIYARVPFLGDEDNDVAHGCSAGRAVAEFTRLFAHLRPDLAIVYGDRYELLSVGVAAVITRTPLAHLCGGDITEGAIDDQVRHALTKMAHLHFPSTRRSAERLLQMGEEPWRVRLVGDPAIDSFVRGPRASAEELSARLGFKPDRSTLLVTFHPATLELEDTARQVQELTEALRLYPGTLVITAPAPDPCGLPIREAMERLTRSRPGTVFVHNLGQYFYVGLMYLVGAMVGNSSSGLNQGPCVPLPVVNVGNRQQGRDRAANVIDVPTESGKILEGINKALSPGFRETLRSVTNPYGAGDAAARIVNVLSNLPSAQVLRNKRFYSEGTRRAEM
jgi:UDP-hydrolysing UDP-N-acetyl-D-glucosamine 2-epimerase